MSGAHSLEAIEQRHPEWAPWLRVLSQVVSFNKEDALVDWDADISDSPTPPGDGAPLLAGARLPVGARVAPVFDALLHAAKHSGAPAFAGMHALAGANDVAGRAFRAAIDGDESALVALASATGLDPSAFVAVATLLPMPFLHACRRRWTSATPRGWTQGYCPCCGAWPALAETCGVERNRYLRCGRCGTAWQMPGLACPYCGMNDHEQLASLLPDKTAGPLATIEVCRACMGYLKAFSTLRPAPAHQVMLDDLATVELDLAATARDYRRPAGLGYQLRTSGDSAEFANLANAADARGALTQPHPA